MATVLKLTPSQARSAIVKAIQAHLVPMLHGSPAIGKSSIVRSIAEEFNLKLIDLRLSQCDPTDLLGFPTVVSGRATYTPMDTFPIAGDNLPEILDADGKGTGKHYAGWLLFLDELPTAPPAVQAAAYKLILDRMVGNHMLHKKLAIVGAGNLESDNALVSPMSTALQSRMVHLQLRMDVAEWLDWARTNNIDFRITSYVDFKKEVLYTFQPDHTDHTYASPRTWHFADAIIKVIKTVEDTDAQSLLGGCLSEGVASEFIEFCRIESEIPKMRDIIADPGNVRVPSEASFLYLLCGAIGANATKEHLDAIATYVKRFPAEFQVIGLKNIVKRDNTAMAHPAIQKWIATSGAKLF